MKVWILSQCEKWEGDYVQQVFSDEGLDRYLHDHPEFKLESDGAAYSTYTAGSYSWHDITPYGVDTGIFS